jgi:hypothetical protein
VQALSSTPPVSGPGEVSAPQALTSPGGASTAGGQVGTYLVTGQVIAPGSASVAGLAVRLVDKNVGGDVQLTTGSTDYSGGFALRAEIAYGELRKRHKAAPDLQVQITQGKKLVASSAVSYGALSEETLNVFLPPGTPGLASEYEALTADIVSLYAGSLADLKEDGTQQDITYLANKSGWDARPLAMAIQATLFSQNHRGSPPPSAAADSAKNQRASGRRAAAAAPPEAAPGAAVAPAFYYALFRAGMAADPATLYRTDQGVVEGTWTQAIAQGVIPSALKKQIPAALQAFQSISAANILQAPPLVGPSSLGDLARFAFPNDTQGQQRFAGLYVQYRNDPPALWAQVSQMFGAETASRVQLTGQLAYLTVNNASLITALYKAAGQNAITSASDLVVLGYYQAPAWAALMANVDVPAQIPGSTPKEQKNNYADLLAAQVRLSYPTAVMGQMVSSGTVPVLGGASVQGPVAAFLAAAQGDFDIGSEPVSRYLARTGTTADQAVVDQVTRIQRVQQITPSTRALSGLLQAGVDSAYAVTCRSHTAFVVDFAQAVGGEDVASAIYSQARTIYASTLGVTLAYLNARRAPVLGSPSTGIIIDPLASHASVSQHSPSAAAAAGSAGGNGQGPVAPPVLAQATLQELFGNLDYCVCDDCQSITGPAAYLVDLLDYIDVPTAAAPFQNPQTVLLGRRPDIGALPLTCDNTTVALPYIDLVNETLEYYVANQLSLADYAGHTTDGTMPSGELNAAPQFDDTAAATTAYTTLKAAWGPVPLPFHQSLEQLRLLMSSLGLSLPDLMVRLRNSDSLERGAASPGAGLTVYGWRDILAERLGMSRPEYRVLTDSTIPLGDIYGYPPNTPDGTVVPELSVLQEYSRRTAVSYDDLASILGTTFINPSAALIPLATALGVGFTTLRDLHDGTITAAQFTAQLSAGLDPARYGGDIVAWVDTNYDQLMGLIVIDVAGSSCDTSQMNLAYANPGSAVNQLQPIDFLRIQRFIRLWRKLELSIERTDDLIAALCPPPSTATGAGAPTPQQDLDRRFLLLLPRLGFAYEAMNQLGLDPQDDLQGLLACWAPIDTAGTGSLYAQMFLNPTMLLLDPAFQPTLPDTQPSTGPKLQAHQAALCAAFNLTGAEFSLIIADLSFDGTTPLTLPNITEIYRRGWLARALRLSVRELLLFIGCSGLKPFGGPPDPAAASPVEPPLLLLARAVRAVTSAGLQPVQVLYLLWNWDLSGTSAPTDAAITGLAGAMRQAFAAVDSQFTVKDDPTGTFAKSLMTLVTGAATADFFFGLLTGTVVTSVPYSAPAPAIPQAVLDAGRGRLSYDAFAKQLRFAGLLDPATQVGLITAAAGAAGLVTAINDLATANAALAGPFFADHSDLGLQALGEAFVASADPLPDRYDALLADLLAGLVTLRKEQQALAAVTAAAGGDPSLAPALLGDETVMHSADGLSAAVTDLTGIGTPGLDVQYTGNDPGTPVPKFETLTYSDANPLPPPTAGGTTIGATWTGYLCAQEDGDYNLRIDTDHGATVTLKINATDIALTRTSAPAGDTSENSVAVPLTAGMLTPITVQAVGLSGSFSVGWETLGTGWQPVPAAALYPATLVENLRVTYVRFLKITALAGSLSLTAAEIVYLVTDAGLTAGGKHWTDALVTDGQPDPATSTDLGKVLDALLAYAHLKATYAPGTQTSPGGSRLLGVLQQMTTAAPDPSPALLVLTGWDSTSLAALLQHFYGVTNPGGLSQGGAMISPLVVMRRLDDAFTVFSKSGVTADTLIAVTTNDPDNAPGTTTAEDFQRAVRSRYAEPDWLAVVRPVSDTLRELERDALVAYVLVQAGESILSALEGQAAPGRRCTADDLFSYFLFDVEMQPCMETSRVRHALSSVQLFIERALRNLEPLVNPADIDAGQWVWRKRYRVWQANREVFLWPENWLDESLRDDRSPFFQTTMKQLLQSDITDDSAASAYLDYLSSLEQVAKLEPCGICYVTADDGSSNDIAHVVARTAGAHRKHYYRQFANGAWTPWEEIQLSIEDVPVVPYVWNGRLLLFWLQIHHSPAVSTGNLSAVLPKPNDPGDQKVIDTTVGAVVQQVAKAGAGQAQSNIGAVLYFSEYYNGKWQPPKTSDLNNPLPLLTMDSSEFDRSTLALRPWKAADPADESLYLQVTMNWIQPRTDDWLSGQTTGGNGDIGTGTGFVLYNTHSAPRRYSDVKAAPLMAPARVRELGQFYSALFAAYGTSNSPGTYSDFNGLNSALWVLIDNLGVRPAVTEAQPDVTDQWDIPFFVADPRNVFYVTTEVAQVLYGGFGGFILGDTVLPAATALATGIPDLVTLTPAVPPGQPAVTADMGDPDSAQRALLSTARFRIALSSGNDFEFNGRQIGFAGSVNTEQARPAATDGKEAAR